MPRKPPSSDPQETPTNWADNKVALAAALGVSRQTIYDWGNLPGCPGARSNGKYNVAEWREFAAAIGSNQGEENPLSDKAKLEARRLRAQCERLELRLAIDRGEYTPNEVIGAEVRGLANELISLLQHELENALPRRCAQKSSAQIRAAMRESLDRIMGRIHEGAGAIEEKFPAAVPAPAAEEQPEEAQP